MSETEGAGGAASIEPKVTKSKGPSDVFENPAYEFLFLGILFAVFLVVRILVHPQSNTPDWVEAPVIVGPLVSALLTFDFCVRFILASLPDRDVIAIFSSIILLVLALIINFFLSSVNIWYLHLALLLTLFLVFCVWDYIIIRFTGVASDIKDEVRRGSYFINLPTLVTVILVFAFLWAIVGLNLDTASLGHLESPVTIVDGKGIHSSPTQPIVAAFTAGATSFHLFLAAIAYFIVSGRASPLVGFLR